MPLAALLLFPMQFLKNKLSIFAHLSGPEEEVRVEEGGGGEREDWMNTLLDILRKSSNVFLDSSS